LVAFKIKNLATSNCVKDWGKMTAWQGCGREGLGRVRVEDAKFDR